MVTTTRFSFGPPIKSTPLVIGTIIALTAIYIVSGLLLRFVPSFTDVYNGMILETPAVLSGQLWRLASYSVLHSLFMTGHLVFNCIALFFFARELELLWGKGKLALFFLAAVLSGGVSVVVASVLGIGNGSALGFSAVTEACIVGWAMVHRDRVVNLLFLPPMRGVWVMGLAIIQWVLDAVSMSPVSAAAHFGGILLGLLVGFNPLRMWRAYKRKQDAKRFTVVPRAGGNDRWVN